MISYEEFKRGILPVTLRWEGGYANIKADRGGETYRGISRRSNPDWTGWKIIDLHKLKHGDILNNAELKDAVAQLYWEKYFKNNGLHKLNSHLVAVELFDFAVLGGFSRKKFQRLLNDKFGSNLLLDGVIGKKTASVANSADTIKLAYAIVGQRNRYMKSCYLSNPAFVDGWANRLEFFRKIVGTIQ